MVSAWISSLPFLYCSINQVGQRGRTREKRNTWWWWERKTRVRDNERSRGNRVYVRQRRREFKTNVAFPRLLRCLLTSYVFVDELVYYLQMRNTVEWKKDAKQQKTKRSYKIKVWLIDHLLKPLPLRVDVQSYIFMYMLIILILTSSRVNKDIYVYPSNTLDMRFYHLRLW